MCENESRLIEIFVRVGEIYVSDDTQRVISAIGLGSCVGVIAFDPIKFIGGIAHIQLPSSNQIGKPSNERAYGFADTGIPELLQRMEELGACSKNIIFVLAGGAELGSEESDVFKVGIQNHHACLQILDRYGYGPYQCRLGGKNWRSVKLFLKDARISILTRDNEIELIDLSKTPSIKPKSRMHKITINNPVHIGKHLAHILEEGESKKKNKVKFKSIDELKRALTPIVERGIKHKRSKKLLLEIDDKQIAEMISERDSTPIKKGMRPKRDRTQVKNLADLSRVLAHLIQDNQKDRKP